MNDKRRITQTRTQRPQGSQGQRHAGGSIRIFRTEDGRWAGRLDRTGCSFLLCSVLLCAVRCAVAVGADPDVRAINFHIGDGSRESSRVGPGDAASAAGSASDGVGVSGGHRLGVPVEVGQGAHATARVPGRDPGPLSVPPGYADSARFGSAHDRGKLTETKDDDAAAGITERLGAGITRPTNLSSGERPHRGVASDGTDIWEGDNYGRVGALPPAEGGWWPHWASLPAFWYPWNVNLQAYRLGMIPVITICVLGTDKRHHRWLYYVVLALCIDYLVRTLAGPRASLCTLFGEILDNLFSRCRTTRAPKGLFPRSIVAGAPYQFQDFVGFLILGAATICFFDSDSDDGDTAGAVLIAFWALIAFLELVFALPVFVWLFNQMVHFGWLWKDSEIKAALMRDEQQRAAASDEMRSKAAKEQMLADDHAQAPKQVRMSGKEPNSRALPYSYRAANEYHKRREWHPIRNIKVTYFLADATLAALSWVWVVASREGVFSTPDLVWQILAIAALALFALHFLLYLAKVFMYPRHVMWEWEHPLYRSMFLAAPLAWLLFIPAIVTAGYPTLAEVVFWIGAPLLLFIALLQLSLHYHQNMMLDNFGGAWLMIPTALAVSAFMLTQVHRSYSEAAWLWLGVAVFLWIIFSTLLVFKGAFQPRQHDAHRYYIWLMMAAAFAISIALVGIYAQPLLTSALVVSPPWNTLGVATFYTGLALFLMLLVLTLMGYFGRTDWNVSWWVVPLCLCLMSVSCLYYHALWRSDTTQGVATTALVITNIACALMFFNHIRALCAGELYRPDHLMLSPLEFFRLPNRALREVLTVMSALVNDPKCSAEQWRHLETVLLPRYAVAMAAFSYVKRGALFPVLAAWFGPGLLRPLDDRARQLDDDMIRLGEDLTALQTLPVNSAERAAFETRVRLDFAKYAAGVTANMDDEDAHIFTLARRYIGGKEANAMVRKSWDEVPPNRWAIVIPFIVEFLHSDGLRCRWLQCLAHAAPEHIQLVGKQVYEGVDPFMWERLVIDLPEMRPRYTRGYSRVW